MKLFEQKFTDPHFLTSIAGEPDERNLCTVLEKKQPKRHTLFEFFLNDELYGMLAGEPIVQTNTPEQNTVSRMMAYANAGYDYFTFHAASLSFPAGTRDQVQTLSLNEGECIRSWEDFDRYPWPDAHGCDYSIIDSLAKKKPEGLGLIPYGPGGVLENVIRLTGYDNLCYMIVDMPDLASAIFDRVGSTLNDYYSHCSVHPSVIACISNDDWGFNTQTMLSTEQMRTFVFPWHAKIVQTIRQNGKYAILHSCGNYDKIIDDMVHTMGYDARHSFEDNILPIEKAYRTMNRKMALLGGIDVDFICRADHKAIYERACGMLEIGKQGGYALGSGNSIPSYVPFQSYFAMIAAALVNR